jgi:hypothetical protein
VSRSSAQRSACISPLHAVCTEEKLGAARAERFAHSFRHPKRRSVYCRDAAHDLRDLDRRSTPLGVEHPPRATGSETFTPFGHVSASPCGDRLVATRMEPTYGDYFGIVTLSDGGF